MGLAQTLRRSRRCFIKCAAIIAAAFVVSSACAAQATKAAEPPDLPWLQELRTNPELVAELGKLAEKLQHEIQYPPPRSESRILPVLPEATTIYAALPNYGEVVQQALNIFRQERQENSALRDWLQHGAPSTVSPVVENSLEKASQFFQYLGDEMVVSGAMEGKEPRLLIVAEVRKAGLKNFLQEILNEFSGKSKASVRVLDQQELASAGERRPSEELVVLVRPDFVAGATDLATLRSFSARMDRSSREFATTPFGQRVADAYQGGVTGVGAVDLHKILSLVPPGTQKSQIVFQSSGFADVKYLVWEHRKVTGQTIRRGELSFNGPRHGVASWLAAPAELSSLDFVSPKALMATAFLLKRPVEIFDDVKEMVDIGSPQAFAMLPQFEQNLNISIKDDLLAQLTGELAFELDDFSKDSIAWKAFARVNDAERLQKTIATLMAAGKMEEEKTESGGVEYHTIHIPAAKKPYEIDYVFADGQLIAGSSRESVAQAIRVHRSGESLGKSNKFLAALPPGHPSGASAVFYEDVIGFVSAVLRQEAPDMAGTITQLAGERTALMSCAYGEETAIRGESTSTTMDASAVLIVAAIAIPNLLRARLAANEASAVGGIRTVNTAEVTYAATYPQRGFAPDLATLGPSPDGTAAPSAEHAGLIDATLGAPSCTGGAWCTKSGFRFNVTAVCKEKPCDDYVVVGTPVSSETGGRSFCSTSDAVIRFKVGPPLDSPVKVPECRAWRPLQ
jgi:type IV pilus assembly protein PilA